MQKGKNFGEDADSQARETALSASQDDRDVTRPDILPLDW